MSDVTRDDSKQSSTGSEKGTVTVDRERPFKVVTAIVALAGVAISLVNFLTTARISAQAARTTAQRPYLERMMPIFAETIQQTGKIAAASSQEKGLTNEVTARFWEIYGGELRMLANKDVIRKLEDFAYKLDTVTKRRNGISGAGASSSDTGTECTQLGALSHALADAMHRQMVMLTAMDE